MVASTFTSKLVSPMPVGDGKRAERRRAAANRTALTPWPCCKCLHLQLSLGKIKEGWLTSGEIWKGPSPPKAGGVEVLQKMVCVRWTAEE